MAASRRPRRTNRPSKAPDNADEIITVPAPATTEATTQNAPVPDSLSSEAKAIRKSTVPKSPRMPGQSVTAAIQSLLQLEKQEQLLEGGVDIISQQLLGQLNGFLKLNPAERVQDMRKHIKNCIRSGPLLPQTKKSLTDDLDRYFDVEEKRLTKEETNASLDLRKLSRSLAVEIRQVLSHCLKSLDAENIPHLSISIYMDLPKPTPDNLKQLGFDAVFKKHLYAFFEENLSKADLKLILEKATNAYPHLFGDTKETTITNDIFQLLAAHTWEVIKEGLGN